MSFRRFTLVELMIVVAIIGILAAIAIPNFVKMQYRSKRAELGVNSDGIKTAEVAYEAAMDTYYLVVSWEPDAVPGKAQRVWNFGSNFKYIDWTPDGMVRGSYLISNQAPTGQCIGTTTCPGQFCTWAMSDVDGDGQRACGWTSATTDFVLNANDLY